MGQDLDLGAHVWHSPPEALIELLRDAYCFVATESAGRQLPIAFLDHVKDDFKKRYGGGEASIAVPNSLKKEFGYKLKEHMQYCVDHPKEISKLAKVKAQVSEVKGVMLENIAKAQDFKTPGTKVKRNIWVQNMKIKLIVLAIIIALIFIIYLSICQGFKCTSS